MRTRFHLPILACILLLACTPQTILAQSEAYSRDADVQTLMQLSRAWSDSLTAGNLEATIGFWADDAVLMAPGQPAIRGKAAIRDFVMAMEEIPGFTIRWEPLEAHVSDAGDLAYLIERNRVTLHDSTGTPVTTYNKVVTVWKRQGDGSWKNVVDMWNADPTAWE